MSTSDDDDLTGILNVEGIRAYAAGNDVASGSTVIDAVKAALEDRLRHPRTIPTSLTSPGT
jgi:hypothetical protein